MDPATPSIPGTSATPAPPTAQADRPPAGAEPGGPGDADGWPAAPALVPFARVVCDVGELVSLGQAAYGERRYVPLLGGTVRGPGLDGTIVAGGVDWQVLRADGVLDIAAHYVVRTGDGALVEVRSDGMRHGPADVLARAMRGEPVARDAYFFRTLMRFATGAPAWTHLNRVMALAVGERQARAVRLDVYRIT